MASLLLMTACATDTAIDPEATVPWVALQADDREAAVLYQAEGQIAQLLVLGDTMLIVRERRSELAPMAIPRSRRPAYPVGRFGGGPGELSYVGAIGLSAGDSLLVLPRMPSMPSSLLSIGNGSGRTLTRVSSAPRSAPAFFGAISLVASDSLGYAYGTRPAATADDSIAIIRHRLLDGQQDTVVWLPTGEPDDAVRSANGVSVSSRGYYQHLNGWSVTQDGRVLLVDVSRYGVTVLAPDRQVAAAWRVQRSGVPVNDSAWNAFSDRAATLRPFITSALRGRTPSPVALLEPASRSKPRSLPLVALQRDVRSLRLDGDDVWIPVYRSDPPRGEHWERRVLMDGTLRQRISLPPRHRLLAVSGRCAMVVRLGTDLEEQLVAVPLPSFGDLASPCAW